MTTISPSELIWRKDVLVAGESQLTVERWLDGGEGERITGRVADTLFWGRPTPADIERDVSAALGCAIRLTDHGRVQRGFALEFRFERVGRCR